VDEVRDKEYGLGRVGLEKNTSLAQWPCDTLATFHSVYTCFPCCHLLCRCCRRGVLGVNRHSCSHFVLISRPKKRQCTVHCPLARRWEHELPLGMNQACLRHPRANKLRFQVSNGVPCEKCEARHRYVRAHVQVGQQVLPQQHMVLGGTFR
jgi:hypothetical protein